MNLKHLETIAVRLGGVLAVIPLLFLTLLVFAAPKAEAGERASVGAVNGLAVDLYQEFAKEGENLCFSPYSISTAFAMVYAGAAGETAAEMESGLRFRPDIHTANRELNKRLLGYPASSGEIAVANSIWPASDFRLARKFENTLRGDYFSEVKPQNYRKDPDGARVRINTWVEEKTRERIKDILARGTVHANTGMVLVNAIYFKAQWMNEFRPNRTEDAEFHVSEVESVTVPMMNRAGTYSYGDFWEAQVVKMPYSHGAFSMIVVLPREGMFRLFEETMSLRRIDRYRTGLEGTMVDLFIPKFRIETSFDLASAIAGLGVKSAFNPAAADFSRMGGGRSLYLDTAVHKAFIEVDEAGTEAAAATAIVARLTSAPAEQAVTFRADRPFLYIIQDDESGAILFMGKVVKPSI